MFMPSVFDDSFDVMDNFFDSMFSFPFDYKRAAGSMSTDITDTGDAYELEIELPGYAKEDVKADLKDGYLTIEARKEENKEDKGKDGQFIRRERYTGECSRSYFVGEQVTKEDIKACFKDGILAIRVPKKQEIEQKQDNLIMIE